MQTQFRYLAEVGLVSIVVALEGSIRSRQFEAGTAEPGSGWAGDCVYASGMSLLFLYSSSILPLLLL
jgi:hypothetical protein